MNSPSFTFSKLIWLKIVIAGIASSYLAQELAMAIATYISPMSLAPDQYSTGFEIVLYSIESTLLVNYLIVNILRLHDHITLSGNMLDIEIHQHTLFLLSKKHLQIPVTEIKQFHTEHILPVGVTLKLILSNGNKKTFYLPSIGISKENLDNILLNNHLTSCSPDNKKKSKTKENILILLESLGLSVFASIIFIVKELFYNNTFMPTTLWIPMLVISCILCAILRDTCSVGNITSCVIGIVLGGTLYIGTLIFNYTGAALAPVTQMEYKIKNCRSVYHPASRTRRRHYTSAHTDYFFSIYSLDTNTKVKEYSVGKNLYFRARHADIAIVPVRRGPLGYPVAKQDDMTFRKKNSEFHRKKTDHRKGLTK